MPARTGALAAMRARWQALAARHDQATLRQRAGVFGGAAALLLYLAWMLAVDPLLREQARLRAQLAAQRAAIAAADGQIVALADSMARDPDSASRARLAAAQFASGALGARLARMQQTLVAPGQVAPLLQSMLRVSPRVQLVALASLPVAALAEPATTATATTAATAATATTAATPATPGAPPAAPRAAASDPGAGAPAALLYRHGVQVTVRGSYLDLVDYMAALETLPARLFWADARLEVDDYPRAHATLTLYTLSLESKWLTL